MIASDSFPWSRNIRQQVMQMIVLLVTLVAVGAGYDIWSHESIEMIEREMNEYHLASNSHYLRAIEELRNIQIHHGVKATGMDHDEKLSSKDPFRLTRTNHLASHYLMTQRIAKGLALEREFADPRFATLSSRLERQMSSLDTRLFDNQQEQDSDEEIIAGIDDLLKTLGQLVRLHTVTRDNRLAHLHEKEHIQDFIFYILMGGLLISGLMISRRSFKTIDGIIEKQQDAEEKIKHQAHYDNLTNLPNRFLALDRLSLMIREARRSGKKIAVLFIDLDFFKKVNDMLGHVSGDKLLIEAARRITRSVRNEDTVGRLGGDEFIVLIGGISDALEVGAIVDNLINQIGDVFQLEGKELMLTASIGISIFPDDGNDKLELIRKADSAMYHSKDSGRNTYSFFTESMNRDISRQLSLEEQLHGALDRGEFEVYYQQKVDINNNRITGAEALLRWNSEVLGSVPPDEFIPVAEQSGLIVPIGQFVLNEALKMAHRWQQEMISDFRIAVNLSPRQFRDPDLVNNIAKALHESEVSSKSLELEITEGVLMSEYIHIERALMELTRLGIVIAMDDFGTGYSSLSYLRNYPFSVIKIDRSFIQDIDSNAMSLKLNHAAIAMAHALNISVVAEGVETHQQFKVLSGLQCDVAQGYYFGKPIPAQQMTELLRSQNRSSPSGAVVDISDRQGYSPKKPLSGK